MQPTELNPDTKNNEAYAYPDNWESCCMWDGKISVHLGYAEHGWVLMSLCSTAYNGNIVIHCSEVFDPFCDLVDWLKAIAANKLPAKLKIDEEGAYKTLIVQPYQGAYSKYADIEIRVIGGDDDDEADATNEK